MDARLSIGGIGVGIETDAPAVNALLHERYGTFAGGAEVEFTLAIRVGNPAEAYAFLQGPFDDFLAAAPVHARRAGQPQPEHSAAAPTGEERRRLSRPEIRELGEAVLVRRKDFAGVIRPASGSARLVVKPRLMAMGVDSFLRICFSFLAPRVQGLLLHAAGMVRNGRAYLFFGPSGTGKTTLARVSQEQAEVLSDEMILVRKLSAGYLAYGTPFFGDDNLRKAELGGQPLAAAFVPVKDKQVYLEPSRRGPALAKLLAAVLFFGTTSEAHAELMARANDVIDVVPCYDLHFRKDPAFWPEIDKLRPTGEPP